MALTTKCDLITLLWILVLDFHLLVSSLVSHLAALGSPQSPGCSSSSPSPGCSEGAGAPSPAGPSPHPLPGSSPAPRGSSSPAGSLTSPSLCGSSAVSLLCPTLRAGGHWPLPAIIQNREGQKGTQRLMHRPSSNRDYAFVWTVYLILQLDNLVIWGLWVLTDFPHIFKLLL